MNNHTQKCHSSVARQTKVEGPDVRRSRSMHENFYEKEITLGTRIIKYLIYNLMRNT